LREIKTLLFERWQGFSFCDRRVGCAAGLVLAFTAALEIARLVLIYKTSAFHSALQKAPRVFNNRKGIASPQGVFLTISLRNTVAVTSLIIAALAAPSSVYAKRMGSGGRAMPRASASKPPAAPAAAKAPVAPATPPAAVAAPVAAVPAVRGPGMMGTMGAAAVGAVAGTMVGSAFAGGSSADKEAKAKEAKAVAAEKEAQALQLKADEAKRTAEAARATVK